jgi:hypothetical protein
MIREYTREHTLRVEATKDPAPASWFGWHHVVVTYADQPVWDGHHPVSPEGDTEERIELRAALAGLSVLLHYLTGATIPANRPDLRELVQWGGVLSRPVKSAIGYLLDEVGGREAQRKPTTAEALAMLECFTMGPVPPDEVRAERPTRQVVAAYPEYYVFGPGAAEMMDTVCRHNRWLTEPCVDCNAEG